MDIEIKTRHFQLDDEAREKIAAQMEKLERFSPRPVQEAKLTLTFDNDEFECDAVLFLSHQEFRARHRGTEPELATAGAAENLQRQLEKFKGKVSAKQRAEPGGLGRAMAPGDGELASEMMVTPGGGFELRDLDLETAREAYGESDAPFLVFRNIETTRIAVVYAMPDGKLGVMEARND